MIVWGMLVEANRSELESDLKEFKVLCFSPHCNMLTSLGMIIAY